MVLVKSCTEQVKSWTLQQRRRPRVSSTEERFPSPTSSAADLTILISQKDANKCRIVPTVETRQKN